MGGPIVTPMSSMMSEIGRTDELDDVRDRKGDRLYTDELDDVRDREGDRLYTDELDDVRDREDRYAQ